MTVRDGVDMGSLAGPYCWPRRREGRPIALLGFAPNTRYPMTSINVNQNTAVNVQVFLRDLASGQGVPGLASQIATAISKNGGAFATITPTITDLLYGWYNVAFTSAHTNTPGPCALRFTAPGVQENDEIILNVVAQDGGQVKPNSFIDNYVYATVNGNPKPTSWRVRVFASKTACDAAVSGHADNADGETERYKVTATYNSDGTVASYKYDKDL